MGTDEDLIVFCIVKLHIYFEEHKYLNLYFCMKGSNITISSTTDLSNGPQRSNRWPQSLVCKISTYGQIIYIPLINLDKTNVEIFEGGKSSISFIFQRIDLVMLVGQNLLPYARNAMI